MGNSQFVSPAVISNQPDEYLPRPHKEQLVNRAASSSAARFGAFEIDFESRELRKHGMRIRMAEKPFQILELLLDRAGHVVTRKALKEKLWPSTHVGFEHSLNTAVNTLRELLGDSAQSPRFIETLPRVGYRFIAPLIEPVRKSVDSSRKMLAILPFDNLSGNTDQEHFADGLTEELISVLGQLNPKRLGVIARTSSAQYKKTKKNISEIARELNINCVLEGSVRLQENRVRVTAQLIETTQETHLWAASYDRDLSDVLSVQSEVARAVSKALAFELIPGTAEVPSASIPPEAHEAYLRGRFFCGQRNEQSLQKAVASFEQALSIEPNCARSLSGIADCLMLLSWFGAVAPSKSGPNAAKAAARALEIDDSLCEPHASLGLVRFWYEWDWVGAEEEFLRAIELNPSYALAHHWYSSFLNTMGRLEESKSSLHKARELDPHSLIISMAATDPLFFGGHFDHAITRLHALLGQEPRFFPALFNIGRCYVQEGMFLEAVDAFEQALNLSGNREALPRLAHAHALAGNEDEARKLLQELKSTEGRYVASPQIALVHLGLREVDEAFDWFNKGIDECSPWIIFLKMDPVYDPLRRDPRFQTLLQRAGL